MKPSELFGVVVRSLGLLLVMGALWSFFLALLNLFGGGPANVLEMILGAIPALFIGVWFLGGARSLIYLAYQEELEKDHK